MRSPWDLHLLRPDTAARFEHIDGLFTAVIDWPLIEAHLPDMLRLLADERAALLVACEAKRNAAGEIDILAAAADALAALGLSPAEAKQTMLAALADPPDWHTALS